jgi:hypothetical protein
MEEKNGVTISCSDSSFCIKGIVVDKESGAPLQGVNVLWGYGDKCIGVATDLNGVYKIELTREEAHFTNDDLRFSFLGKKTLWLTCIAVKEGKLTDLGTVELEGRSRLISKCSYFYNYVPMDQDPDSYRKTTYTGDDLKFMLR